MEGVQTWGRAQDGSKCLPPQPPSSTNEIPRWRAGVSQDRVPGCLNLLGYGREAGARKSGAFEKEELPKVLSVP